MKINFNGKEYSSVDEMPPNTRQAYDALAKTFADNDHNGMPDIFEGKGSAQMVNLGSLLAGQRTMRIIFEGKEYTSMDQLPPEAREKYKAAVEKMRSNPHLGAFTTALASGKEFSSIDQLPPELRDKYQTALDKMRANPGLSALAATLEQDLHPSVQISAALSAGHSVSTPIVNATTKSFFGDTATFLIGIGIVGVLALVAVFLLVLFLFPSILK